MYSLNDAEYYYNKKTKEALHREDYLKLLKKETEGVKSLDGIMAIERRLGFDFCYRDNKGIFTKPDGTILNGLEETNLQTMTPSEYKVTQLVKQAKRNKEIADIMGIGEGTVRTHLRSIFRKLKIKSRAELIIREL